MRQSKMGTRSIVRLAAVCVVAGALGFVLALGACRGHPRSRTCVPASPKEPRIVLDARERPSLGAWHVYPGRRPDGSDAFVYANRPLRSGPPRPLVVVVPGSADGSVFQRGGDGHVREGVAGYVRRAVGSAYTIVVLERRAVEPGESAEAALASEAYRRGATRDGRVADHVLLGRTLRGLPAVDARHVLLLGHSEGAEIAAAAARGAGATHLAFLAGGGPSQMFDFALVARERLRDEPAEDAEKQIAGLMDTFRDALAHPHDMDREVFGHPVGRWASFFAHAPVEDLLALDIPVFVGHGTEDEAVPIACADFVEIEFLRRGKTNLTLRRYPGLDHSFRLADATAGGAAGTDRLPDVVAEIVDWFRSEDPASGTPAEVRPR